jgi:integrase
VNRAEAEATALSDALERYGREISPSKACCQTDLYRIKLLKQHLGHFSLAALNSAHLAEYRDMRLSKVSPQTVKHELSLINRVLVTAQMDWGIHLPHGIPTVRKPTVPRGRDRRLSGDEEQRLLASLSHNLAMRSVIEIAMETAMRRGEIASMRWGHINFEEKTLFIPDTKTGVPRHIPLSCRSLEIFETLPRRPDGWIFGFKPHSITQAFERACRRANILDLRFHDLRHEATSRLFEIGLNTMEVSAITGHKTLDMLKRYTHLKATDLVKKIL